VGRPPQDLMRGWGKPPICKASIPDHKLAIQSTHNIVGKGEKGKRGGQRGRPAKSVKTRAEALGFEGEV
jgi:hypothetical protein